MSVVAVLGSQWGDEGKGKIIDLLAEGANVVVRFSGGPNAGHTIANPHGVFKLHLMPSGIFYPHTTCIIGNGVVVSPQVLLEELEQIGEKGIDTSKLFISSRAHLIMPYHILLDELEEKAKGNQALGTTKSGVGPAYMDKVARVGIRVGDLLEKEELLRKLSFVLEQKNKIITKVYEAPPLSLDEIYNQYCQYADRLAHHIRETGAMIDEAIQKQESILLEGAQGALLDIDFGTYPYVTSSNSTAGGACTGIGLGPNKLERTIGVYKAYTTRVGSGPMPTELNDETGEQIRKIAHEYGATTGRPRRCGWFDAVAARFSASINGLTGFALTRLDILDSFDSIKVCIGYRVNGDIIDQFPSSLAVMGKCQPVYEELDGWKSPTSDIRRFDELPQQAQAYVRRLEKLLNCPADIVSVGPGREQTIMIRPPW